MSRAVENSKVDVFKKGFTHGDSLASPHLVDPVALCKNSEQSLEMNMGRFSAEEALDNEMAYYKDELKFFIAAVTKQVIERHLVGALTETVLSPMVVADMSDEEISFVAAEKIEVSQQREFLQYRKAMLEDGQATFRMALGEFR